MPASSTPKALPTDPPIDDALAYAHGLTEAEWENARAILGRLPTYTELGIFSVMWSEHCSYKSSRVHLKRLPTEGPQVLQGPGENAGIVDIGDGWAVCFKMESHNHPSYIEPYQGAATGVGGILRDVFTMGARPVANLDSLRFGRPDHPKTPHLVSGVVAGIGGYGNCMGVPTVGGEVAFDASYDGNCLVNAFTAGFLRADRIFRGYAAGPGNPVLYVGAKTGRDGIHGATMASESFDEESESKRPTVQVGDPFTEKLLLEACLELFATDCIVGIQDMGAAGLTSSSFEMAGRAGTGLRLDLDRVPQREEKMTPYELMLSESQERMLMVAKKGKEDEVRRIFEKWDLDAEVVGEVTDTGRVEVIFHGEVVADLPAAPLADEAPRYDRPQARPAWLDERWAFDPASLPPLEDAGEVLLRLLHTPDQASKRWVYEQYDHMVRLGGQIRPGEGDAALFRIVEADKSIALSVDCNSRLTYLDPEEGGRQAVAEAARNVSCVGAKPLAITDCLNFGNPEKPEVMWQFARAVDGIADACRVLDTPVTGGNVSLYNETEGEGIFPTPTIGMVGLLPEGVEGVGAQLRGPGRSILLLGPFVGGLGGSFFLHHVHGQTAGRPLPIDLELEARLQALVRQLIADGLIETAHDCSEGGLAVALAELCLSGRNAAVRGEEGEFDEDLVGLSVRLPGATSGLASLLFGEAPSRILVAGLSEHQASIEAAAAQAGVPFLSLGESQAGAFTLAVGGETVIELPVWLLEEVHGSGFAHGLGLD
ncbi:MAG: phosphoribosylformylglycinamidine synthase subunit PurL [Deltaproteobacteria bacterium]|nr:phosphoribosylformylglycinamidine synthase subunit PurL [Deltaproteobacteria bacterium]